MAVSRRSTDPRAAHHLVDAVLSFVAYRLMIRIGRLREDRRVLQ
jgi:hypothetical protein